MNKSSARAVANIMYEWNAAASTGLSVDSLICCGSALYSYSNGVVLKIERPCNSSIFLANNLLVASLSPLSYCSFVHLSGACVDSEELPSVSLRF